MRISTVIISSLLGIWLVAQPICTVAQVRTSSWELGLFGGTSYYTGDLNPGGHFKFSVLKPAAGLVVRRNVNKRISYKFSGRYGQLYGHDKLIDTQLAEVRDANFSSHLYEVSGDVEFNFFDYNTYSTELAATTYTFIGLSAFYFNPQFREGGGDNIPLDGSPENARYSKIQPSIPFGIGVKFKPNHRIFISAEWGLRKTFTDYIDDVSTEYAASGDQRGIFHTKDWYSFAGLIVSIRLGKKPNDCPQH